MSDTTKSVRLSNALYVEAEGLLARHNDEGQDFQLPELLAQLKLTPQDVCRLAMAKGLALLSATSADPVVAGLLEMLEKSNRETAFHARAGAEALVQAQDHHKTEMLGLMRDIEVLKDEHRNSCREIEHSLGSKVREREETIRALQNELDFARLEIRRLQGPLPVEPPPQGASEDDEAYENFITDLLAWWEATVTEEPAVVQLGQTEVTFPSGSASSLPDALRQLRDADFYSYAVATQHQEVSLRVSVGSEEAFKSLDTGHLNQLLASEVS